MATVESTLERIRAREAGDRPRAAAHAHAHVHAEVAQSAKVVGFWIFLATDMLLFGCLFATYLVLLTHTDGGPSARDIFDVPGVAAETLLLLTSSFTGGLATLSVRRGDARATAAWLVATMLLGLGFLGLELHEFLVDAARGATMQRSAFLSAFYTLVGTHGAHVSFGLIWMLAALVALARRGLTHAVAGRIWVLSLYWHFLDIVWVFIFSIVYLPGVVM